MPDQADFDPPPHIQDALDRVAKAGTRMRRPKEPAFPIPPELTDDEYTNLIDMLQDAVDDEKDNPDVQAWVPTLDKLKAQRQWHRTVGKR